MNEVKRPFDINERPQVGSSVWLVGIKNAIDRSTRTQPVKKCVVTKCGTKIFTVQVEGSRLTHQIRVDGWHEHCPSYGPDWEAYRTAEEWLDAKEHDELLGKIRQAFTYIGGRRGFTLDQLRRINAITEEART